MSFFKELKEDIAQSVTELSNSIEGAVTDTELEENKADSETLEQGVQEEIDSILEEEDLLLDMPSEDSLSEESSAEEPEPEDLFSADSFSEDFADTVEEEPEPEEAVTEDEPENEEKQEVFEMVDMKTADVEEKEVVSTMETNDDTETYNSEETTVITKGTMINGGIKSDTSLVVKGVIEGDVECQGKLTITGRVAGNSTAAEIYVNTPRLNGNLVSKGSVKVDVGTVVIGNINSASVVVAGAVKGDIDVNGPIVVDSTAVVQGSIIGKSIQINSGAVVDGRCSLQYADVDLESFFE